MDLNVGEILFLRAVCPTHEGGDDSPFFDPYDAWCWANRNTNFRA